MPKFATVTANRNGGRAWSPTQSRAVPRPPPPPQVKRVVSKPSAPPPGLLRRNVPGATTTPVQPGVTVMPDYRPQFDYDQIKFVDKLRDDRAQSFRDEQGDAEVSTTGATGPGVGPILRGPAVTRTTTQQAAPDWVKPALLALGAYLLFGG